LLIKCPKIFGGSAAAADYEYVDLFVLETAVTKLICKSDSSRDLSRGRLALTQGAAHPHMDGPRSPPHYLQNIVKRSPRLRRHDAHSPREHRQRPFQRLVKEPLGRKPRLDLFQCHGQGTGTDRLNGINEQLVFAADLVGRYPAADADLHPVCRAKPDAKIGVAKADRLYRSRTVA